MALDLPRIFCPFCRMTESEEFSRPPENRSGFSIHRGTAVSSLFIDRHFRGGNRKAYYTSRDSHYMLDMGFDHVRLPVSEMCLWGDDGKAHSELLAMLNEKVSMSIESGLRVIVCIHFLRSHPPLPATPRGKLLFSNPGYAVNPQKRIELAHPLFRDAAQIEVFCNRWQTLSGMLRHHPVDRLAYELFNEPFAPSHDLWNRVWGEAYQVVRKLEPDRTIIVGSNLFQIPPTIKRLDLPPEDKNLLPAFHFYYPDLFTHYRANWQNYGAYNGPIQYPGRPVPKTAVNELSGDLREIIEDNNRPITRQVMRQIVMDAKDAAAKTGHGIYCGEFGCMNTVPYDAKFTWYRDIVETFDEFGVPWTQWDWKGQFGILDAENWQPTGSEKALGLRRPPKVRPPNPNPPIWRRVRRKLGKTWRRLSR